MLTVVGRSGFRATGDCYVWHYCEPYRWPDGCYRHRAPCREGCAVGRGGCETPGRAGAGCELNCGSSGPRSRTCSGTGHPAPPVAPLRVVAVGHVLGGTRFRDGCDFAQGRTGRDHFHAQRGATLARSADRASASAATNPELASKPDHARGPIMLTPTIPSRADERPVLMRSRSALDLTHDPRGNRVRVGAHGASATP